MVILSVCYHASCYIPRLQVQSTGFLMAFQTHDLCGFPVKRFVCQFWRHLLILSFLTSRSPGQLWVVRINRMFCVSRCIRHRLTYTCARVTRAGSGDEIKTIGSYAHPSVLNTSSIYGSPSEACHHRARCFHRLFW